MGVEHVTGRMCWLGVGLLLLFSCSRPADSRHGEKARAAEDSVASGSEDVGVLRTESAAYRLGRGLSVQNLTVWPVEGSGADVGVFLTLAEAESRGVAEVREKEGPDSSGAEVNRLVVRNRGNEPILICAGTVLKGGNQDRQVARDHVVAPRSEQALEAFCVEQGRWTAVREGRRTAGAFSSTDTVANKRIRASAQYLGDQSQVWANVARVNGYAAKAPRTDTFLATLEDESALKRRGEIEDAVRKYFDGLQGAKEPVGFAYAINGEPLTMRTFASPDLFRRHFPAFRRAMCIEADVIQRRDLAKGRAVDNRAASAEIMLEMLRAIEGGRPLPILEVSVWRILTRESNRGAKSTLWVRRGLDPKAAWAELTADWTAPLEYEAPIREYLEKLKALGYTQ